MHTISNQTVLGNTSAESLDIYAQFLKKQGSPLQIALAEQFEDAAMKHRQVSEDRDNFLWAWSRKFRLSTSMKKFDFLRRQASR